ncbi:hypothetical protein tinsulaeT_10650 [Thalassotalea insulae]|uniref:Recombinase domain-containing protein n=1 Tax=Thalassotalea insulae TaxID=2056778 RepID=A0ABQ6GTE5_9GAMM|nr:hypothetical protein tinsulaeT_10650 [Thalassotalea insulae]
MKRQEQKDLNNNVISFVYRLIKKKRFHPPSYKFVCSHLNEVSFKTSRGKHWTPKRLFRMLQRNGFGGLYGLYHSEGLGGPISSESLSFLN